MTVSNMSAVIASGTLPPAVRLSGVPTPIVSRLRIEVEAGGARGAATFRWRPYDAADWEATQSTAASVALGSTGLTATFGVGTYNADNAYESTARSRFARAGVEFPLTSDTANSLLRDADPALFWMLEFIAAILQAHLGDRLQAEASRAGMKILAAVARKSNVDQKRKPWLQERNRFPLLAIYRQRGRFEPKTTVLDAEQAVWGLMYILPEMSIDQQEKLEPALAAASKIIQHGARDRHDKSFMDDEPVGAIAGLSSIRLVDGTHGVIEVDNAVADLVMPFLYLQLEVVETARSPNPTARLPFEGVLISQDLQDPATDTELEDAVVTDTPVDTPTFP